MTLGALDQRKSHPPATVCAVEDFWFAPVIRAHIALGRQSAWAMGNLRGLG